MHDYCDLIEEVRQLRAELHAFFRSERRDDQATREELRAIARAISGDAKMQEQANKLTALAEKLGGMAVSEPTSGSSTAT